LWRVREVKRTGGVYNAERPVERIGGRTGFKRRKQRKANSREQKGWKEEDVKIDAEFREEKVPGD
jgi:hypothetical protein